MRCPPLLGVASICLLLPSPLRAEPTPPSTPSAIELEADAPIDTVIEGKPAKLSIVSGFVDRLTLSTAFVEQHGIKPAPIMGNANIKFWGRKEIKGKNRPLTYTIGGKQLDGRVFWFLGVPQPRLDGTIGPFALPFDIVTIRLGPAAPGESSHQMVYVGDISNGSNAGHIDPTFRTTVSFSVERERRFPLASAATGAALAVAYGGTLSGEEWQEEIALGVTRPVRLLTLERPFAIGALRFTKIAVRVRSTRDGGGSGEAIAEATVNEEEADPAEIVVMAAGKKARMPIFTLDVGRNSLQDCSAITFDKPARRVRLTCRAVEPD